MAADRVSESGYLSWFTNSLFHILRVDENENEQKNVDENEQKFQTQSQSQAQAQLESQSQFQFQFQSQSHHSHEKHNLQSKQTFIQKNIPNMIASTYTADMLPTENSNMLDEEHVGVPERPNMRNTQFVMPPNARQAPPEKPHPTHMWKIQKEEKDKINQTLWSAKRLQLTSRARTSSEEERAGTNGTFSAEDMKLNKFRKVLAEQNVDLAMLRKISWSGVPAGLRCDVWRLLFGYCPTNLNRLPNTLERRRFEYKSLLEQHYYSEVNGKSVVDNEVLRQIQQDVPRTLPTMPFFKSANIQASLERVLYVWAVRHPASGYVQGINDLATPFYTVFVCHIFDALSLNEIDSSLISEQNLFEVEADAFWCLSNLIESIQDNYTFAQPGIQRMIFHLKELVQRVDAGLTQHLEDNGLQFIQFAFRWMNCLLMRELSLPLILRLWDTYLAEEVACRGFKHFHVYVCAALLLSFSDQLKKLEFQDMLMFLQKLPTESWTEKNLETLLAQAFVYKSLFDQSPHHLQA